MVVRNRKNIVDFGLNFDFAETLYAQERAKLCNVEDSVTLCEVLVHKEVSVVAKLEEFDRAEQD